jgi:anaerobic magnesium-protoporphyrin IX monomethyl ester cyclase
MRVLISHSYFLRFDPKAYGQMRPYPPLGTLYAAAVVREAGHEVAFFDAMLAESEGEIEPLLRSFKPDAVVFFEDNFNYLSKMCLTRMRDACVAMTRMARRQGARVIVQGSDPVDHPEPYFDAGAEVIIKGEGERTLVELLEHLEGKRPDPIEEIPGLILPRGDEFYRTPPRALIRDLDTIPYAAWDLVDMDRYREAWKPHGFFSLNLVTTRGCPFHCNWCAKPVYGSAYASRSPAHVVGEQLLLKNKYGAQHIWFADDIFGLKPGWVREYADEVARRNARLPFMVQTRVDLLLNDEQVQPLADAGCEEAWVGAESGSQRILDAMDKGTRVEEIAEATRQLKAHGIRVAFFLQYGYRGETKEDIALTRKMVRELQPDNIGISVSYPLPGTKFYDTVVREMGMKHNWKTSGDLDLMYQGTYSAAFYRALHTATHKEFRLRESLRLWRHPLHSMRTHLRRMIALPWYAAALVWKEIVLLLS